ICLGASAIQGSIFASEMGLPLSASIAAAALTGTGGGMIRDLLADRKPLFLKRELYIVWTLFAGIFIGLGLVNSMIGYMLILALIDIFRLLAVHYHWYL